MLLPESAGLEHGTYETVTNTAGLKPGPYIGLTART